MLNKLHLPFDKLRVTVVTSEQPTVTLSLSKGK